jgi:hypothetical protein
VAACCSICASHHMGNAACQHRAPQGRRTDSLVPDRRFDPRHMEIQVKSGEQVLLTKVINDLPRRDSWVTLVDVAADLQGVSQMVGLVSCGSLSG